MQAEDTNPSSGCRLPIPEGPTEQTCNRPPKKLRTANLCTRRVCLVTSTCNLLINKVHFEVHCDISGNGTAVLRVSVKCACLFCGMANRR